MRPSSSDQNTFWLQKGTKHSVVTMRVNLGKIIEEPGLHHVPLIPSLKKVQPISVKTDLLMTPTPTFTGLLQTLHVKDLMTPAKNLTILDDDTPLNILLTKLQEHGHAWITHNDTLTGIITRTDTHSLFAPPVGTTDYDQPSHASLAFGETPKITTIMTPRPFTITPTDTLNTAMKIMKENKINQLAVLDDTNRLIGELTTHHLITRYLTTPPQPTDTQQTI